MDLTADLQESGGVGRWSDLTARFGRRHVPRAVAAGLILRVGRGRYVLGTAPTAHRAAAALRGVVSMRSAAQTYGWAKKQVPIRPDVTVPRNRRISRGERRFAVPHWSDLPSGDVVDGMTTRRRTLVDCLRMLPLVESLPIAESALRCGDVTPAGLRQIAHEMRGRGRRRAIKVAALASTRTMNAYESVLHAIAASVPGMRVQPQRAIRLADGRVVHPDFVDVKLRLVIEAESFAWHGETAALTRDCERYNAMLLAGWTVVRFSWSQVMFKPDYVVAVLSALVARCRT